jgi:transcriptional regulator with XRE-family HTH domain
MLDIYRVMRDTLRMRLYLEFGSKLKASRKQAGLTQQELADRAGLQRTTVTNIESGGQRIALHQLYELASAVGLKPGDLLPEQSLALEDLVSETVLEKLPEDEAERRMLASVLGNNPSVTRGGQGQAGK